MSQRETTHRLPSSVLPSPEVIAASVESEGLLDQTIALTSSASERGLRQARPIGFAPAEISALVHRDIVLRHAEEAAFLWLLRDRAVVAPHYSLTDVVNGDERVEAHADGLRIAGDDGWKVACEALQADEPGETFVAGLLAAESGLVERLEAVLPFCRASLSCARAMVSALGWATQVQAYPILAALLDSDFATDRLIGVGGFAAHAIDPEGHLLHLLYDEDENVRQRALRAAGELGRSDLLPQIMSFLTTTEPEMRFSAAWSAARLGDRSDLTVRSLEELAAAASTFQEAALTLWLRIIPRDAAEAVIRELWQDSRRLRLAAIGIGALGTPEMVPALIEMMSVEPIARVAGEAFSLITGVDLAYADLDCPPAMPSAEDGEADPDDDLPWPDADLIAAYWQQAQTRFPCGHRYLCGQEVSSASLVTCLRYGLQRQRAAAALELGLLRPTQPLFPVRAPGKRQQRRLAAWTS